MEYRYSREGDSFCWTGNYYMLRYSEPSVDVKEEYETLDLERGKNDIKFLAYNMELLVKVDGEWIPAISDRVGDFPAILDFQNVLRKMLDPDMQNAQVYIDTDGNKISENVCCRVSSINMEDYYAIRRSRSYMEDLNKPDRFDLYVGIGELRSGSHKPEPYRRWEKHRIILLEDLLESDIETLYTCVKRFLEFAEDQYNADLVDGLEQARCDRYIEGGVLLSRAGYSKPVRENDMLESITFWYDSQIMRAYGTKVTFIGDSSIVIDKVIGKYDEIDVADIVEIKTVTEAAPDLIG